MAPGVDDEFMVNGLVQAANRRVALFVVNDSRIVVQHFTDRKGYDFVVHADSAACRLENAPVVKHRFNGLAFALEFFVVFKSFVLIIPIFFRCEAFVEDFFRNGNVFPVADILIAEVVEVILFLPVFFAGQVDEVLRQVDVFVIVPVRREVIAIRTKSADAFRRLRRDALHEEGVAVLVEPFVHAQDALRKAAVMTGKGRQPELLLAAAGAYVQYVVFLCPLDFIRVLPSKQVHKGRVGLLVSLLMKIVINNLLVFQSEFSERNNSNSPYLSLIV